MLVEQMNGLCCLIFQYTLYINIGEEEDFCLCWIFEIFRTISKYLEDLRGHTSFTKIVEYTTITK
jgi:hypothetical protein